MLMISPERRILILLAGMIAGIALVTIFGVAKNLLGIPLTGLWIMPVMLQGRHGQALAVARHRTALIRACRSGADLVLSFAAPRYDCQVTTFSVSRLWDANFLLLFNGDESVTVRLSPADSRRTGVTADRIWPVREDSRK